MSFSVTSFFELIERKARFRGTTFTFIKVVRIILKHNNFEIDLDMLLRHRVNPAPQYRSRTKYNSQSEITWRLAHRYIHKINTDYTY